LEIQTFSYRFWWQYTPESVWRRLDGLSIFLPTEQRQGPSLGIFGAMRSVLLL
jgi:hypothetical protein